MIEAFGLRIQVTDERGDIEWMDLRRKSHKGPVIVVEARSDDLWAIFDLRSDSSTWLTTVNLAISKPEYELLLLQRKTDMYQRTPNYDGMIYHPMGFARIDSGGRLRRKRISSGSTIHSSTIRSVLAEFERVGVEVVEYEEATGRSPPALAGKLCTLVRYENWEPLVAAYIGEKMAPLIEIH